MAAATAAAAAAAVRAVAAGAGAQREPPLPPASSSSSPRAGFPAAAATARAGCPRSGGGGVGGVDGFGRRSCLAVGRGREGRRALALSASSSPLMRTSSGMWWHESRQSQQQHQQQHRQQRQQQWEDADDVSVGRGPVSCMAASPSLNGGPMGVDVAAADEQLRNAEPPAMTVGGRHAVVSRVTRETSVEVSIGLDGTGQCSSSTGIPFLDHMIDQLASHGLFDVTIRAEGDLHIDDHHTNEDVGLALGTALAKALGDRKGIHRFGDFCAPLDEALVHVVLDLSGRPHLSCDLQIPTERVGTYDTQLVEHFFQSLVNTSGMTLHIRQLAGKNSHHIIEATFKAFARALRVATEVDPRRANTIPSSKGVLSRQ